MAEYPRVEPEGDIRCGRRGCGAVFYKTPGKRPFVIGCDKCSEIGVQNFVRADTAAEAERLWRELKTVYEGK